MEINVDHIDLEKMIKRIDGDIDGILKEIVLFKLVFLLEGNDITNLEKIDESSRIKAKELANKLKQYSEEQ